MYFRKLVLNVFDGNDDLSLNFALARCIYHIKHQKNIREKKVYKNLTHIHHVSDADKIELRKIFGRGARRGPYEQSLLWNGL